MHSLTLQTIAIITCFIIGVACVRITESLFSVKRIAASVKQTNLRVEQPVVNKDCLDRVITDKFPGEITLDIPIYCNADPLKPTSLELHAISKGQGDFDFMESCLGHAPFYKLLDETTVRNHIFRHFFKSHDSIDKIAEWYSEKMQQNGWTRLWATGEKTTNKQDLQISGYQKLIKNREKYFCSIIITEEADYQSITITVMPEKSLITTGCLGSANTKTRSY